MEKLDIIIIKDLVYSEVKFWSIIDNDFFAMRVLIDTGARITTFSDSALIKLGYATDGKPVTVRTGGGTTIANEITIPKIQIGSTELTNISAHSNKFLDEFKINGILGMNVLSKFNFNVDFDNSLIELKTRKMHQEYVSV